MMAGPMMAGLMMAGLMMAELRGAAPQSGAEFGPANGFRPAAQLHQT
jgi:hypothetical protein